MIDIIIITIIILFASVGYHVGLIKTTMTLVSSIAAFVLSFFIYPMIYSFLKITPLYFHIYDWLNGQLQQIDFGTGMQTQANSITQNITWFPKFISDYIIKNNNQEVYELLNVTHIEEYISVYLTQMVLNMVSLIITWIILKVLLTMFLRTTDNMISHLPIISTVNKIGGLGIGLIKGVLSIWLICLAVPFLITYSYFSDLQNNITQSYLGKWLYENNMILQVFDSILKL